MPSKSMECNRDEASRAKSIAESKLEERDFISARKFALKAQTLYPGFDGISQLMKTIDVYVSAENKISGEDDWYGVPDVSPSADEETIRKQYRKMALVLHPDENKSAGAVKLVSEAWNLLSDKAQRLAYNQRRGYKGYQQKVHLHSDGSSVAPHSNCVFRCASVAAPLRRPPPHSTKLSQKPSQHKIETFWTTCHGCKTQYEYDQMYLNQTLRCPKCRAAFIASRTAPPPYFSRYQIPQQQQQQESTNNIPCRNVPSTTNGTTYQKSVPGQAGSDSSGVPVHPQDHAVGSNPSIAVKAAEIATTYQKSVPRQAGLDLSGVSVHSQDHAVGSNPSVAVEASEIVMQAKDKLKRACSHSFSSLDIKRQKFDGEICQHGMKNQGNDGIASEERQLNNPRDLSEAESQNMLMVKGLTEIQKLLMNATETTTDVPSKEKAMTRHRKKANFRNGVYQNRDDKSSSSASVVVDEPGELPILDSADIRSKRYASPAVMIVPDPDFHDFDQDRAEHSFQPYEVWSAYDDDDGMPRLYALVNRVISRKPFKLKISWLNSKSNTEFSSIDWVRSGFYKTCGEFRVGRHEICKSINAFSQKVKWFRNTRGSVLIYPKRGDAWALYKDWSPDWNSSTPDEIIHRYEMVTVVDDYNEEHGVLVAPLVKVPGFRTAFKPNMERDILKTIPRAEMFRFSHRVPYHLLTGFEAHNSPKGLWELDPAATPMELLQVITEGCDATAPQVSDETGALKAV